MGRAFGLGSRLEPRGGVVIDIVEGTCGRHFTVLDQKCKKHHELTPAVIRMNLWRETRQYGSGSGLGNERARTCGGKCTGASP